MRRSAILMLAVLLVLAASAGTMAEVEWNVVQSLSLDSAPRDVTVTLDGRTLYVLTEKGDILVYDNQGNLKETIAIGPDADSLKIGQNEDVLYVISRKKKTIETIQLDFIKQINIEGAPFQGPADAPVVIAVFSDFQ